MRRKVISLANRISLKDFFHGARSCFSQWLERFFSRIDLFTGALMEAYSTAVLWTPDGRWYCGFCSVQRHCAVSLVTDTTSSAPELTSTLSTATFICFRELGCISIWWLCSCILVLVEDLVSLRRISQLKRWKDGAWVKQSCLCNRKMQIFWKECLFLYRNHFV